MAINVQLLELRFQNQTGCKPAQAKHHTKKYLKQCALAMVRDNFTSDSGSGYYIYLDDMRKALGYVMVSGTEFPVLETFDSFKERIFTYITTGSNITEKITMAHSQYTIEEIILAAGSPDELAKELYKPFAQEIAHNEYDLVPVNMRSLENYIKSNLAQDRSNPRTTEKLLEEWNRNLKHAQKIWMLAQAGGNQLVQIRNESQFGRKYYKGPNLQNTPKIVRHAALGHCHEYDIESSVFAWKLSWFRSICKSYDTTINMPATLEYLDHKKAIRTRLAQAVFDTEADWAIKTIKEFITAIGFGAPLRGVGYNADGRYQKPALAQIITAKNRLDRAMADTWVQEFVQEQSDMNDAIFALCKVNMIKELKTVPELWEKGGKKLKPNSVVSYLYQHAEREILDWVENFCADREVLLTVHDCIYTRRPVKLAELRSGIAGFGEYFKITHEEHKPWGWEDPVAEDDPFYDPRDSIVAKKLEHYDNSRGSDHWNGSGYDGRQEYDIEDDPYFDVEES